MSIVFKTMPLGATWRHRQNGIETVQRLDLGGFLVHAEYRGMVRRLQVKTDNIRCLALEIGAVVAVSPSRWNMFSLWYIFALRVK